MERKDKINEKEISKDKVEIKDIMSKTKIVKHKATPKKMLTIINIAKGHFICEDDKGNGYRVYITDKLRSARIGDILSI